MRVVTFIVGSCAVPAGHFCCRLWNAEGLPRSGVGQKSQEAIASALKLALRRVSERFNAAEVEHIELKKYPIFLAKVRVYPYQIQQSAVLSVSDESITLSMPPPAKAVAITGNQVAHAS